MHVKTSDKAKIHAHKRSQQWLAAHKNNVQAFGICLNTCASYYATTHVDTLGLLCMNSTHKMAPRLYHNFTWIRDLYFIVVG